MSNGAWTYWQKSQCSNNISICHFQETNIETLSLTPVVSFGYLQ